MWWRIILVLLVLVGLIGFGLVYFDPIWSMVQNFWGLDDALRKKILDLSKIIDQFFGFIAILAGLFVFIFWFIKTTGYQVWDMSGNVFEWISSLDPNSNPFIRGESWNVNPNYLRCAACFRFHPFIRDSNVGFRVVFSLAAES